jgi:hypothetical protein
LSWILRRGISGSTFGGGTADQLPARGALGLAAKAAVDNGYADAVTGFRTEVIERGDDERLTLVAEDGRRLDPVDEVVVLTGLRPDLSFLSELRLGLDERLQAPMELAPLIDPNQHSCGTVYPHGHRELSHPEQGLYLVGMKSYGRAPTFLAMTGYEQVRFITAALAGDTESADRVELTLPETGVCGGAELFDAPSAGEADGGGCCAPEPALVQIGAASPAAATAAEEPASSGGRCTDHQLGHRLLRLPRPQPTDHREHRLAGRGNHSRILLRPAHLRLRRNTSGPDHRSPRSPCRHDSWLRPRRAEYPHHRRRPEPAPLLHRLGAGGIRDGSHLLPARLRSRHSLVGPRPHPRTDHRDPRRRTGLHPRRPPHRNPGRPPLLAHDLHGARRHPRRRHHPRTRDGAQSPLALSTIALGGPRRPVREDGGPHPPSCWNAATPPARQRGHSGSAVPDRPSDARCTQLSPAAQESPPAQPH